MRTATASRQTVSQTAAVMQKPGLRLTLRGRIVAAVRPGGGPVPRVITELNSLPGFVIYPGEEPQVPRG
jgi:hypothetical protein